MNTIKSFSVSILCTALVFGPIGTAKGAEGENPATVMPELVTPLPTSSSEVDSSSAPLPEKTESTQDSTLESIPIDSPSNKTPDQPEAEPPIVNGEPGSAAPAEKQSPKVTIKPWIKTKKVSRHTFKKGLDISVVYPRFTGEPKDTIAKLNKLMKKTVNCNMPNGVALEESVGYMCSCEYEISSVTPEIVSVDLNFYSYLGGAHGNGYTVPFNYQLTSNGPREITIKNLFGRKPNVVALQNLVRPRLIKTLYPEGEGSDDQWINDGTAKLRDFKCISLDKDGVTFNFQSYQVACYAAGAPSVKFKYHELAHLFNATSPLYNTVLSAKLKASKKHVASKRHAHNKVASRVH